MTIQSHLAEFQGVTHDRSASPIHIRIVRIGRACHPLYVRLDAPLLCSGEEVKVGASVENVPVPAVDTILNDFWASLPPGQEVRW